MSRTPRSVAPSPTSGSSARSRGRLPPPSRTARLPISTASAPGSPSALKGHRVCWDPAVEEHLGPPGDRVGHRRQGRHRRHTAVQLAATVIRTRRRRRDRGSTARTALRAKHPLDVEAAVPVVPHPGEDVFYQRDLTEVPLLDLDRGERRGYAVAGREGRGGLWADAACNVVGPSRVPGDARTVGVASGRAARPSLRASCPHSGLVGTLTVTNSDRKPAAHARRIRAAATPPAPGVQLERVRLGGRVGRPPRPTTSMPCSRHSGFPTRSASRIASRSPLHRVRPLKPVGAVSTGIESGSPATSVARSWVSVAAQDALARATQSCNGGCPRRCAGRRPRPRRTSPRCAGARCRAARR